MVDIFEIVVEVLINFYKFFCRWEDEWFFGYVCWGFDDGKEYY